MLYCQIRNYLEIAYILKNNYISIDDFISLFNLSKYEYKSDLQILKEMQEYYGIKFLINENDQTIFYQVTDVDEFSFIYPIFNELYFRYHNTRALSKKLITNCIVTWTLLSSNEPISTSDIADDLGYSRSGIRSFLKWAKDHVENYNLQYTNIPHYGIQVNGNEFYKRLAIISLNNFIDPRIIIDINQDLIYNHSNQNLINNIYQTIDEINSYKGISFSFINIKLLSYYLIIQHNRILNKNSIVDVFENADEIINTFEYYCASVMMCKLYPKCDLPVNETIYLSILLITMNENIDYNHLNYFNYFKAFKDKTDKITENICHLLNYNYGLSFNDSIYLDALKKAVNRILIKQQFKMNTFKGFSLSGKSYAATKKPLLLMIRYDILDLLSRKYNIKSQKSNMIELIDVIQRYIQIQDIYFQKKKLYIITHLNILDSILIKDSIKKRFPNHYFDSIEIENNPKIIDTSSDESIYIANYYSNLKNCKNVYILDKNKNDIEDLKEFLISNNHLSFAHINHINSKVFDTSNTKNIFEIIGININECKFAIRDNIMFVMNTNYLYKANLFLYKLTNKVNILNNKDIDQIVYLECNPKNNNIRLFDYILTLFMTESSFFDLLFRKPDLDILNSYLIQLDIGLHNNT